MYSKKTSKKKMANELNNLVREKFRSEKIPTEIFPYIGKEYGKGKRILFVEWGTEWNDDKKAKNAKRYYSGELDYNPHEDIKICSQKREIEEVLSKAKDYVSVESLAWCNFFIRPMRPGACDSVRELFDILDKKERTKFLSGIRIQKEDLGKSSAMFKALIKLLCPDIILIFGETLKDILDSAFGGKNFEEMLHDCYSSPVSVHVIPFSYFEKVDLDSQLCYMERYGFEGERSDVIFDMKKESERYDYSEVAFYLQNELKMLGLGDYEYYKEKITECQKNILNDFRDYEECIKDIEYGKKRTLKISCLDLNGTKTVKSLKESRIELSVDTMKILAESRLRACFWGIEREHMYFNHLCGSFDKIFELTKKHPNTAKQRNAKRAQEVAKLENEYKKLRTEKDFEKCRDIESELRKDYDVIIDKDYKNRKFNHLKGIKGIKQLYEKAEKRSDEVVFINLKPIKKFYQEAQKRGNDTVCKEIEDDLKKLAVYI